MTDNYQFYRKPPYFGAQQILKSELATIRKAHTPIIQ